MCSRRGESASTWVQRARTSEPMPPPHPVSTAPAYSHAGSATVAAATVRIAMPVSPTARNGHIARAWPCRSTRRAICGPAAAVATTSTAVTRPARL